MQNYNEQEIEIIEKRYNSFIDSIKHTISEERLLYIEKAFRFALSKRNGDYRYNGKPSILHVIDVAEIVCTELGLRSKSVAAAFFHGITRFGVTIDEIKEQFGDVVANIVDGYEKMVVVDTEKAALQPDKFVRLFLSMAEDIRVIMLMIAHNLYYLRNQGELNEDGLNKYYIEAKYLVIPILHRLGLYNIKQEFEERVMKYEHPDEFEFISRSIKESKAEQEVFMEAFMKPIREALEKEGIEAVIKWRTKSIPSIYAKMKAQNVPLDQVYDLFAIRIIIQNSDVMSEIDDCWKVFSLVTNIYEPKPGRMRDWVTKPKITGYESLHITVKNADKWIEVQIRTQRMDDVAERGCAAHWHYKGGKSYSTDAWLNQIRDVLETEKELTELPDDRLERKVRSDVVFVLTPQNEVKQLPVGSTVLDFAFEIHTQVGLHCNGAYINKRIRPIHYVLSNGDTVEVIVNKKQFPRPEWLSIATTERAKNRIRRYLRDQEMKEAELGSAIFHRKLKNWKINYDDKLLNYLLKYYNIDKSIELFHLIATEKIDMLQLKGVLMTYAEEKNKTVKVENHDVKEKSSNVGDASIVIDGNMSDMAYKMAKCCNPIPGDAVKGFVSVAGCITVHRTDCRNFTAIKKQYPYRVIDINWDTSSSGLSKAYIRVTAYDVFAILNDITGVFKQMEVNILNANLDSKNGFFEGRFLLEVKDTEMLDLLIRNIKSLRNIIDVQRT